LREQLPADATLRQSRLLLAEHMMVAAARRRTSDRLIVSSSAELGHEPHAKTVQR
jgi:hypothetical protein